MNSAACKPVHTVSVRDLVQFVLRGGDLGAEREFVGPNRALAGIRGHQKIQRSRPAGYRTEIATEHTVDAGDFTLKIRGRIDGVMNSASEVWIEEIKTVQGSWDRQADPLHWAQAKSYGFIYTDDCGLQELTIQLAYLELETGKVTEFRQVFSHTELAEFFISITAIYVDWIRDEFRWRQERDVSINALKFPFPDYRPGQRELAVAVYRTLTRSGRLFLAAPTGIGKTLSVLFPAVKALGEGKVERIFYLTARTVGRTIAEKACANLRRGGLKLRVVTLTAKEKVCVRDGHPCDPLACPLAIGYYDRVKPAIRDALKREEINRATLEEVAQKHQVCPFELSLDVSVWSDAVICDYNYVFDPQVYLRRHFGEDEDRYAFLVDEAHNLVDRAREMFSADLDSWEMQTVRRMIRPTVPRCARALTRLISQLKKLAGSDNSADETSEPSDPSVELNLFPKEGPVVPQKIGRTQICRELSPVLIDQVESTLDEAEIWLAKNQPADFRESLLALYFRLHSFLRTAGLYDERYVTMIKNENGSGVSVRLFCLDPSFLLRAAQDRGQATVFFSATLTPIEYYRTLLGGEIQDPVLQLPSPFPSEHLAVMIQDRIRTHFKGRAESLVPVATAIQSLVQGRQGNYLVYFPSYQYLNDVLDEFQSRCPTMEVLVQRPKMTEAERDQFLAAFAMRHEKTLVGFAVMGGIFGEGIDLVGERLIGAVIVGVGLPQLCAERDLIRDYFQQQNQHGFEFAYTFPGMNRVLQAIGRVIRSERDRGVVVLIDARFSEARYRRLFPPWWNTTRVRSEAELARAAGEFWNRSS